jgi:hypothetical protein
MLHSEPRTAANPKSTIGSLRVETGSACVNEIRAGNMQMLFDPGHIKKWHAASNAAKTSDLPTQFAAEIALPNCKHHTLRRLFPAMPLVGMC